MDLVRTLRIKEYILEEKSVKTDFIEIHIKKLTNYREMVWDRGFLYTTFTIVQLYENKAGKLFIKDGNHWYDLINGSENRLKGYLNRRSGEELYKVKKHA